MKSFTLEITYSQVAVFNHLMDRPFNNWTEEHFDQGFVWRPQSVSFRTPMKHGLAAVNVVIGDQRTLRPDASLAISVPFENPDGQVEVASVFKGEVVEGIESGSYELLFSMGGTAAKSWADFLFIPGKIARPEIVKPHPMLRTPKELLLTAEPA